jgi:hypothetical protein
LLIVGFRVLGCTATPSLSAARAGRADEGVRGAERSCKSNANAVNAGLAGRSSELRPPHSTDRYDFCIVLFIAFQVYI